MPWSLHSQWTKVSFLDPIINTSSFGPKGFGTHWKVQLTSRVFSGSISLGNKELREVLEHCHEIILNISIFRRVKEPKITPQNCSTKDDGSSQASLGPKPESEEEKVW